MRHSFSSEIPDHPTQTLWFGAAHAFPFFHQLHHLHRLATRNNRQGSLEERGREKESAPGALHGASGTIQLEPEQKKTKKKRARTQKPAPRPWRLSMSVPSGTSSARRSASSHPRAKPSNLTHILWGPGSDRLSFPVILTRRNGITKKRKRKNPQRDRCLPSAVKTNERAKVQRSNGRNNYKCAKD